VLLLKPLRFGREFLMLLALRSNVADSGNMAPEFKGSGFHSIKVNRGRPASRASEPALCLFNRFFSALSFLHTHFQ